MAISVRLCVDFSQQRSWLLAFGWYQSPSITVRVKINHPKKLSGAMKVVSSAGSGFGTLDLRGQFFTMPGILQQQPTITGAIKLYLIIWSLLSLLSDGQSSVAHMMASIHNFLS
ncbi:predicted protein [Lichtheimia corymbifera JMRC:FSU:9682]|uniref:Uncharacterized protein n=1 Tax=Lichtheimia corymbifera JMRC:FSU:9682 TaxID=1263082 RepID=A0A068RX62_9FUNG|nr:predicted protein [Lichtheimia corymbifera JMRC:FSU:9682]